MPSRAAIALAALTCAGLALWGCGDDRVAGTEVENEIGYVFQPGGGPAAGAEVRVIPVGYNPLPGAAKGTAGASKSAAGVYKLETDARGSYNLHGIPAGQYNILAAKEGLAAFRDSINIDGSPGVLASDTLAPTAGLSGIVQLQPNHNPATATVQFLGTTIYANVDAAGRFRLEGLAAGIYQARIATTLPEYTSLFVRFTVAAGTSTAWPDTLRPVYTGIPVIEDLKADYDTASGAVRLSWAKSDYPNLIGYLVYRDTLLARSLSTQPINKFRIVDTVYADTLAWTLASANEPDQHWEYRVAVLASNGKPGETFLSVPVTAVSPATRKTFVSLATEGAQAEMATVGGPIRIIARFRNATQGNAHVTWFSDASGSPVREKDVDGRQGADTLETKAPDSAGPFGYEVRVTDAAGRIWSADTSLLAVRWKRGKDRPWPAYASAGKFPYDMPIASIGGKVFVMGSRGEYSHPALTVYDPASDAWRMGSEAPVLAEPVPVGGALYLIADSSLWAYDPAADAWTARAAPLVRRKDFTPVPALAVGGRLIAYDGVILTRENGNGDYLPSSMEAYDPAADSWTRSAPPYSLAPAKLVAYGSRLFKTGFRTLSEYDSGQDKWNVISTGMPAEALAPMAALDNALNFLYGGRLVATLLLDGNVADYRASLPVLPAYTDYSFQVLDGRIYGLFQTGTDRITVITYRRAENKWSIVEPIATQGNRFACAVAGDSLVVISFYDRTLPDRYDRLPAAYVYPPQP
ncbi:MAG: carboxypeptidase regulatory-like domain-containing protein [Fibrobacteres bacterium]|nr:carboxypeptidase regulatory-like domain-containing protein [Fibrobacterota bacterium]